MELCNAENNANENQEERKKYDDVQKYAIIINLVFSIRRAQTAGRVYVLGCGGRSAVFRSHFSMASAIYHDGQTSLLCLFPSDCIAP